MSEEQFQILKTCAWCGKHYDWGRGKCCDYRCAEKRTKSPIHYRTEKGNIEIILQGGGLVLVTVKGQTQCVEYVGRENINGKLIK